MQTLLPFADNRISRDSFLSFEVIGRIFGISPQQAIRLHDKALAKVRERLKDDAEVMGYVNEGQD